MKLPHVGLVCGALGVIAGCASGRRNVITNLPGPLFSTKPAPARPVTAPRVRDLAPKPKRPVLAEQGWYPPGGTSSRWQWIVIHHSGGPRGCASAFDHYHRTVRGWDELGYHFVVGNGSDTADGQVEVGSRWRKQKHGAHCKTPGNFYNAHGIGICLVGDFSGHRPSSAQMASLRRLVRFLMAQTGIPPERVTAHRNVTHRTECPGRRFPLAALKRDLEVSATASSFR